MSSKRGTGQSPTSQWRPLSGRWAAVRASGRSWQRSASARRSQWVDESADLKVLGSAAASLTAAASTLRKSSRPAGPTTWGTGPPSLSWPTCWRSCPSWTAGSRTRATSGSLQSRYPGRPGDTQELCCCAVCGLWCNASGSGSGSGFTSISLVAVALS